MCSSGMRAPSPVLAQAESWDVELRGKEKLAHMLRERRREALLYL